MLFHWVLESKIAGMQNKETKWRQQYPDVVNGANLLHTTKFGHTFWILVIWQAYFVVVLEKVLPNFHNLILLLLLWHKFLGKNCATPRTKKHVLRKSWTYYLLQKIIISKRKKFNARISYIKKLSWTLVSLIYWDSTCECS